MPAVAPINESEVAIVGGLGLDEEDGEVSVMGDVVIFNVSSQAAEKPVKNFKGLMQLCSFGNQAASVGDDTIVILGMDDDRVPQQVIEFKKGMKMLKSLGKI